MNLLVTGATGFVGRNLLLQAVHDGHRVYAPVRDAEKLKSQILSEDIDPKQVVSLGVDPASWPILSLDAAVLSAGVLFARTFPEYLSTNVVWTQAILRALPKSCPVVILSSQSAGGPTPEGLLMRDEATADDPITWYGESKLRMERAIRRKFPKRKAIFLRPPMILGARDAATLPLFKMAGGALRPKPGLRTKSYSFIHVDDLVRAIFASIRSANALAGKTYYVSARDPITDRQLIEGAGKALGRGGFTLPLPQDMIKMLSLVVDAVPALRNATPSLTRDRAREIWKDRWVVDAARFEKDSGWEATRTLEEALAEACAYYRRIRAL